MSAELAARLAALDLRQADASALMVIAANPGMTASALARQLDIQRANMVPLLNRLEEADLIGRSPIDGKSRGLELTSAGREKCTAAQSVIDAFEADMIARIPEQHRAHLLPALDALWR